MAMKVRQLSKGNDITFTHKCPNCKATLKTIVGIDEFEVTPFNGMYTYGFELPGRGYKDSKGERLCSHCLRRTWLLPQQCS